MTKDPVPVVAAIFEGIPETDFAALANAPLHGRTASVDAVPFPFDFPPSELLKPYEALTKIRQYLWCSKPRFFRVPVRRLGLLGFYLIDGPLGA